MTILLPAYVTGAVAWAVSATAICWRRSGQFLLRFALLAPLWPIMLVLFLLDTRPRQRGRLPGDVPPAALPVGQQVSGNDWYLDALREADALCPGSEPLAPPRPPPPPPWWAAYVENWAAGPVSPMLDTWRLKERLGGHVVERIWLEKNRYRMVVAIDELDNASDPRELAAQALERKGAAQVDRARNA